LIIGLVLLVEGVDVSGGDRGGLHVRQDLLLGLAGGLGLFLEKAVLDGLLQRALEELALLLLVLLLELGELVGGERLDVGFGDVLAVDLSERSLGGLGLVLGILVLGRAGRQAHAQRQDQDQHGLEGARTERVTNCDHRLNSFFA
jgi:hypothetical protein